LQRPDWPDPNLHRGWKELLPQMSAYGSMVLGRFRSIGKRRSQPHLTTAAFSWKCSFPWVKYRFVRLALNGHGLPTQVPCRCGQPHCSLRLAL